MWSQHITREQPSFLLLNYKTFSGLIDTNVNVTIIASMFWLQKWPTLKLSSILIGGQVPNWGKNKEF